MSLEVLMNVTPTETRVVLVENGILQEVHIERQAKRGLVGNIYMGKVSRVLPGMQAAFIDIGLDKAAFLHASDIVVQVEGDDLPQPDERPQQNITELVHQGQHIMVQVVKDPLGTKGARLTTDITLPSRYLVFMPKSDHVGVSQRIEEGEERERLREIAADVSKSDGKFIVRTAAEGAPEQSLRGDADFLFRLWDKIKARKKSQRKAGMLYEDLNLSCRVLRDFLHSLEQALGKDRAKTTINGFTSLGLVEMTRKRIRESLEHVLCSECPVCQGRGSMKTVETVCYEIMREIVRVHKAYEADKFVVYASAPVSEALLNEESHALAELELFVSRQIKIQTEPLYNQEQFDVVMM
ncbi:MAG: ribonuclease E/G [Idiomarina sp.]|nr:ribonuclease E/G [Idiomarina sp.]